MADFNGEIYWDDFWWEPSVNYHYLNLEEGTTYYLELEGSATGIGTLENPFLSIRFNGSYVDADDNGGFGLNSRIVLTPEQSGEYELIVEGYDVGSYRLRVNADDYRNTVAGIGEIGVVGNTLDAEQGRIDYEGDADVFSTQLISGLAYTFTQSGDDSGNGTLDDPYLRLLNRYDDELDYDDDSGPGADSSIAYRATYTGAHYLQAGAYFDEGTGSYRIDVSAGWATSRADVVVGTNFADNVNGLGGNDSISGRGGADSLYGGGGADTLRGESERDILTGWTGADILIGGSGADTFVYSSAAHSSGSSTDILRRGDGATAFQGAGAARGDWIDLDAIDANTTRSGNQDFRFGSAGAGGLSLVNSGSSTLVRGNTDGDSAFEFVLRIEDGAVRAGSYSSADFFL